MLADPARHHFFGQYHQDWFMYMHFFKTQKKGFYVDVGSNHYVRHSNSFFFDFCLGWKGLCVEPNPIYHEGVLRVERVSCVPLLGGVVPPSPLV